jgi:hypothetical protein
MMDLSDGKFPKKAGCGDTTGSPNRDVKNLILSGVNG